MVELILIEDFPPLRRVLNQTLRDAGFNVTSFENGQISNDAAVMAHADLLITDIEMPLVDGHEVLENVRKILPNLKTVVISGTSEENLEGVEATIIIRKPFDPKFLVAAVTDILAGKPTA